MKKLLIGVGILFSSHLLAQEMMHVNDNTYEKMFTGYDTEKQEFLGVCVTQDNLSEFKPGTGKATFNLQQSLDQKQVSSEFGFKAGAKWRTGVTKYSVGASFVNNTASSGFSISSTYSSTYDFAPHILDLGKVKLNGNGKAKIGNPDLFRESCGDEFIYKQFYGAKLYFNIRIDFDSKKSKQEFEANFSMNGSAASASANLRIAKNKFSKRTKVTISALQIGGNISKITEIIGGNGTTTGESGFAFKECSFGNLTQCEQVLTNAITYATDTRNGFPSQLEKGEYGPLLQKQVLKSYKVLEDYPQFSSQLTLENKNAMDKLNDRFEALLEQEQELKSINNGVVRLSSKQKEQFDLYKDEIEGKITVVVNNIEDCYHNLYKCLDNYNNVKNSTQLISEEKFEINQEIFAQVCDYAKYFGDSALEQSVSTIIDYAKEVKPEKFKELYVGHVIDECGTAQSIIEHTKEISLKGKSLEDYSVLRFFSDLEKLTLSKSHLRDINFLSLLPNLEFLDLSENSIREISVITKLKNLRKLNLRSNRVKDVSALENMANLSDLDIRNNSHSIKCPTGVKNCQNRDLSNLVEISPKYRDYNLPMRQWHNSVSLGNSVLVMGGAQGGNFHQTKIELMDENEDFKVIGNLISPRMFFTSHRIGSNKVIAIGGLLPTAHCEMISVNNNKTVSKLIKMNQTRYGHSSIVLPNGDVLVTGGFAPHSNKWSEANVLSSAELYISSENKFIRLSNMNQARAGHTMTILGDEVLIVGGSVKNGASNSAEIFNYKTKKFRKVSDKLYIPRGYHTATKITDNKVIILGGFTNGGDSVDLVEVFNYETESFEELDLNLEKARGDHFSIKLKDDLILVVGGSNKFSIEARTNNEIPEENFLTSIEIVDTTNMISTKLYSDMQIERAGASLTHFGDNKLLILGGNNSAYDYLRSSILNF